jgi:glycosyltransferase involved in cell wall biosynthesis
VTVQRSRWDILTGEYPPQPGGVADYTQLVAEGLTARGCDVHVWTAGATGRIGGLPESAAQDVTIHRIDGAWTRPGLAQIGEALGPPGSGRCLLVQYTPNAWGRKGTNLGFCRWLAARGHGGDPIRVMFHELYYYIQPRDRPIRWLLPLVHRAMLRIVLSGCTRIDYATGEWGRLLQRYASARRRPMTWLPVPSTIPVVDDPEGVATLRRRFEIVGQTVVGSFATYGENLRGRLLPVFPRVVLARPERVGLLIGRNAKTFAAEVRARHPELADRLVAVGDLEAADVSRHLQICNILVQPYPDGICGRRTTAMACLAHGLAIATNLGPFTEPELAESGCAAFASGDDPDALIRAAESLLADPEAQARARASARATYDAHFALHQTLDALAE